MFNYKTTTSVAKGLEQTLDSLWNLADDLPFLNLNSTTNSGRNFPPYNIIEMSDGTIRLDLAVAGYTRDRLSVELQGNSLVIKGSPDKGQASQGRSLKSGISNAAWVRAFDMAPHSQVDAVTLKDGILSIAVSTKKEVHPKTTFTIK